VLSRLFRRLFLKKLKAAYATGQLNFFSDCARLGKPHAFAAYLAPLRKAARFASRSCRARFDVRKPTGLRLSSSSSAA
jgi:hypothetical protein